MYIPDTLTTALVLDLVDVEEKDTVQNSFHVECEIYNKKIKAKRKSERRKIILAYFIITNVKILR